MNSVLLCHWIICSWRILPESQNFCLQTKEMSIVLSIGTGNGIEFYFLEPHFSSFQAALPGFHEILRVPYESPCKAGIYNWDSSCKLRTKLNFTYGLLLELYATTSSLNMLKWCFNFNIITNDSFFKLEMKIIFYVILVLNHVLNVMAYS